MKKIKRTREYQLTLEIPDDTFIATPRPHQRNWLLNRFLKEAGEDLQALHVASQGFVAGSDSALDADRTQSELDDDLIMEEWQIKVMREMATEACQRHGDVLEVGFGRGIASDFIQSRRVRSHTIVECNHAIIEQLHKWKDDQTSPGDIHVIEGLWQESSGQFGQYDGIFFHTYPLNQEEYVRYVAQSSTFAEHFFDTASNHLKDGGVFTYLTTEIDSISRSHQRTLLDRFRSISIRRLVDLDVPHNTRDSQWAQTTVVVSAKK